MIRFSRPFTDGGRLFAESGDRFGLALGGLGLGWTCGLACRCDRAPKVFLVPRQLRSPEEGAHDAADLLVAGAECDQFATGRVVARRWVLVLDTAHSLCQLALTLGEVGLLDRRHLHR